MQSCKSKVVTQEDPIVKIDSIETVPPTAVLIVDTIDYLKRFIDSLQQSVDNKLLGESIYQKSALLTIYKKSDFQLQWNDSNESKVAIQLLISAWKEGLEPRDYHLDDILYYFDQLQQNKEDLRQEAILDLLLSDALISYSKHLTSGKINPETLYPKWNFYSRTISDSAISTLFTASKSGLLTEYIESLAPQTPSYQKLKEALIEYNDYIHYGAWDSLILKSTLRPGDSSLIVPLLRIRLNKEGYNALLDSSLYYDEKLSDIIKNYQQRSGLKSDGVIGKHTLNALNESAESKRNKITVNLERSRWVLENEMNEFIVVNIAKFELFHFDSGYIDYSSKVMVGKNEKQTPVFRDLLQYIVFNPTWTIPTSISSSEILPKLIQDSLYLEEHNMIIIDAKGETQSDSGIVWSDYSEDYFPFILRQKAGPKNALGRVKFLFPNQYAIYLHDTPSRYLFAKEERAFSHGCIRLQNPLDFAQFILSKEDSLWTLDSIRTIIDSAQTTSVRLRKGIPIYLMYWTAGVNENNEVFFVPDIYGRDEKVLNALLEK